MSSTSLYGSTGNVTVSSNNLTTLYNTTTGSTKVANVPDRNFTTLYSSTPVQITPTKPYGNANVQAFLNLGTDGSNTVQNITMTGNLTVGGVSDLGPVGNLIITGGNSGYVLTTNGLGELIWAEGSGGGGNTIPYIHFDVSSTSNNQTFTNSDIGFYPDVDSMAVMKNGINIEPSLYEKSGNVLTVNILLNTGDTIDILPSGGGGGGLPGGLPNTVQFNNGYTFAGDSTFTFDDSTNTLTVANVSVTGEANLGPVGNVTITGGSSNQSLLTDGSGNLSWGNPNYAGYAGNVTIASQANITSLGTLTGLTSTGTIDFTGGNLLAAAGSVHSLKEPAVVSASSIAATQNIDVISGSLFYFTGQIAQDTAVNIRGNSSTTLNSIMAVNDTITVTVISTNNSSVSHLINDFQIDGTTTTPNYVNATPTPSTTGMDIYVMTIIKTASATYTLIVNQGATI